MSKGAKANKEEVYPDALFTKNEKVLCYHGPLIYEGKVLVIHKDLTKSEGSEKYSYLIHYAGWSKKWDEYVPESRVLKFNEENEKLRDELKQQQQVESSTSKKHGKKSAGSKGGPSAKKLATAEVVLAPREESPPATTKTTKDTSQLETLEPADSEKADDGKDDLPVASKETEIVSTAPELTFGSDENGLKQESEPPTESRVVEQEAAPVLEDDEDDADREVAQVEWESVDVNVTQRSVVAPNIELDAERGDTENKEVSDEDYDTKIPFTPLDEVEFQKIIPLRIYGMLADDYIFMKNEKMYVKIPADVPIRRILYEYTTHVRASGNLTSMQKYQYIEIVQGIKENFKREILRSSALRYEHEMEQSNAIMSILRQDLNFRPSQFGDELFSKIYGIIHLMRFCSNFAMFINRRRGDEEIRVDLLKECLVHFYEFIVQNMNHFYDPEKDYVRHSEAMPIPAANGSESQANDEQPK